MRYLLIIFLLYSQVCFAQAVNTQSDVLPTVNTPQDVVVLNNMLRQQQLAVSTVGGYFTSAGLLAASAGGTGDAKSAHIIGNMYYDDGTDFFQNVGIGTSNTVKGYFLATNGSAAPTLNLSVPNQFGNSGKFLTTSGASASGVLSWGSTPLKITSVTTINGVDSGDIAITNTKQYFAKVVLNSMVVGNAAIWIRLNNDSTGNTYSYVFRGFDTSAAGSNGNAAATATKIITGPNISPSTTSPTFIDFYLYPQGTAGTKDFQLQGRLAGDSQRYSDFFGVWQNTADVTSFRILNSAGNSMTGTVYLYEYSQS